MQPPYPSPDELIPHRAPMLMVQRVLSHSANQTECEGRIDSVLAAICGGEVSAAFGLELIAQTAAVHYGLCRLALGFDHRSAARGLLLGSRRLQLAARTVPTSETLRVTIVSDAQPPGPGGMIRFEGKISDAAGCTLASGDATVLEWRPDEPIF